MSLPRKAFREQYRGFPRSNRIPKSAGIYICSHVSSSTGCLSNNISPRSSEVFPDLTFQSASDAGREAPVRPGRSGRHVAQGRARDLFETYNGSQYRNQFPHSSTTEYTRARSMSVRPRLTTLLYMKYVFTNSKSSGVCSPTLSRLAKSFVDTTLHSLARQITYLTEVSSVYPVNNCSWIPGSDWVDLVADRSGQTCAKSTEFALLRHRFRPKWKAAPRNPHNGVRPLNSSPSSRDYVFGRPR